MYNAKLPNDTMIRFLDVPPVQHSPTFDTERPQSCGPTKDVNVPMYRVVDGEICERLHVRMSRTLLDKLQTVTKGEA